MGWLPPPFLLTSCFRCKHPMKRSTHSQPLSTPSSLPPHAPTFRISEVTRSSSNHDNHSKLLNWHRLNWCSSGFGGAGVAPMLGKISMSFSGMEACEEMYADDDLSDECSQAGEKKKRLNMEQVRTLEKNFELGNKLEPERKIQLAKALGLRPRQVAIWFQNRRARWKTKQMEKDYDVLKRQFEAIKSENDALQAQNKKLQAEILALKGREASELINLNKETEGSCSNRSENSSEINLDISRTSATESPLNPHQSIPFFPSIRPADIDQLLQSSSRPELQCPKIEQGIPDGTFGNMLCSMEEQASFWPWSDHQGFH